MRKHYLDNIRSITVLLVVLFHVIYMFNGQGIPGVVGAIATVNYQDAYQYIVYPWFMLILFVISGMCSRYYLEKHTHKEFFRSRTEKLLVPSTLGLLVFQWIQGFYNLSLSGALKEGVGQLPGILQYLIMVLSGTGVLWYIQVLWVFSLLLIPIRNLEKDRLSPLCKKAGGLVCMAMVVPVFLCSQLLNTPVIVVYHFGKYGICFFLGYFLFAHEEVIERLVKFCYPLMGVSSMLAITYTITYFGDNYADQPIVNNLFSSVYGWCAVLAILAAGKKWGNGTNRVMDALHRVNFGLYVFHYLPLSMAAYYLHIYCTNMMPVLQYLMVGVAAYAGGIILYEVVSRVPVLRFFVLGIRKKKGC